MTDARLRELRAAVRRGELPQDLIDELQSVVRALVRRRLLPPNFAPYGQWDNEAAEEVFSGWYADRLLGRGHLQELLDRAGTVAALRSLAHRSLRQHLINAADRSQTHNLFRRVLAILDEGDQYELVANAARRQDRWFALATQRPKPSPWSGSDPDLVAHTWALGDFTIIRYRAAATKLSPVLDTAELDRLLTGLLHRTEAALTPTLLMRALRHRFDLGETQTATLDDPEHPLTPPPVSEPADAALLRGDTARAIVAELTPRQRDILLRSSTHPVAALAASLACSVGTIVNEQRRIGSLIDRLSEDQEEREELLNAVADALYKTDDA